MREREKERDLIPKEKGFPFVQTFCLRSYLHRKFVYVLQEKYGRERERKREREREGGKGREREREQERMLKYKRNILKKKNKFAIKVLQSLEQSWLTNTKDTFVKMKMGQNCSKNFFLK